MNICTFPYVWHPFLHLVNDPGLQSTPLDAHREGSTSAPSFRKNYDMRDKLWPIRFHNTTLLAKPVTPPEELIYTYIDIYLEASGGIWCHLESSGGTQETPRRHPGDTQEALRRHPGTPRRHPGAPRRHPGGTQETPKMHPGATLRHQGLQRRF